MIMAEAGQIRCVAGIMKIAEQKNPAVLPERIVQAPEKTGQIGKLP